MVTAKLKIGNYFFKRLLLRLLCYPIVMTRHTYHAFRNFFKDKDGRVIVWQNPNAALLSWFFLRLLTLALADGTVKNGLLQLSGAFLFVWAYLEVTKGSSHFRKALGAVVLASIIASYF